MPGVHTHDEHVPPAQLDEPGHVRVIEEVPSLEHARTVCASTHVDEPGTHASVWHVPATQRCIVPQAVAVLPRPSGLHTERVFASLHVAVP